MNSETLKLITQANAGKRLAKEAEAEGYKEQMKAQKLATIEAAILEAAEDGFDCIIVSGGLALRVQDNTSEEYATDNAILSYLMAEGYTIGLGQYDTKISW